MSKQADVASHATTDRGKNWLPSAPSVRTAVERPTSTRSTSWKRVVAPSASNADGAIDRQKLTHLVIDSGAIIKGAGMMIFSAAENFWTVPEVVSEIRDKKARQHLEALPFELKLREPSDEAVRFVAGFARQTGDLGALSRVDLRVIALTYMLERQETGGSHLRAAPARPGVKANNKGRGMSSTSLEQQKPASNPEPASGRSGDADSSSNGQLDDVTAMEEKGSSASVESLCEALKAASTEEAVADKEEEMNMGSGGAGSRRGDDHRGVMTGTAALKDDRSCSKELGGLGRDERIVDGEKEKQGELEEEVVDNDSNSSYQDGYSSDDDDAWEPEGDERAEAAAAPEPAFTAGDFPSLTGGDIAAIPSAASTSSVSSPPARQEGSWSLLARSNPAPFKVPPTPDPKPVPAAAPVKQHFNTGNAVKGEAGQAISDHNPTDGTKAGSSHILNSAAAFGVSGGGGEDDDGEGWVTPSNFKSHKMAGIGLNGPSQLQKKLASVGSECRAGCVTTDFTMQNVIIQVGLPLLSLDGMAVGRLKQWILRCSACFKTCTDMGRLFCPVCGNATLTRVSCSVNARTGATRLHLKKNYKVNLRGTKYSIPAPNPAKGRFEGDLLLREDQLLTGIWAQKAKRREKDVSSMFGEDITANVGLTVSRSADIVVGYGRKNPNARRGRERRGKKQSNKRPPSRR